MECVRISANLRTKRGKGPARQLRREGRIPAVAYGGPGKPLALSVVPEAVVEVLRGKYGRNALIDLAVEGQAEQKAMLAEFQYDPVTRKLRHVDFVRVALDQLVDVSVPLVLVGRAKGVVAGGTLQQFVRKLEIRCKASAIPAAVEHDVTDLDKGQYVTVKDLKLPEGVSVSLPSTLRLAAIPARAGKKAEEEQPTAAAEKKPASDKKPAEDKKAAAPAKAAEKKSDKK